MVDDRVNLLKPENQAEMGHQVIENLLNLVKTDIEAIYTPLMLIGNARVKVWIALKQNNWMSGNELIRYTGLVKNSVYTALNQMHDYGMIEKKDSMYRLRPDFSTNLYTESIDNGTNTTENQ